MLPRTKQKQTFNIEEQAPIVKNFHELKIVPQIIKAGETDVMNDIYEERICSHFRHACVGVLLDVYEI